MGFLFRGSLSKGCCGLAQDKTFGLVCSRSVSSLQITVETIAQFSLMWKRRRALKDDEVFIYCKLAAEERRH